MTDKHILLVDDEESVCVLMAYVIKTLGYEVEWFTEPPEALEHYKNNQENIIVLVTDLSMRGMTGVELVNKIIEINPKEGIVVVTGFFKANIKPLINTDSIIIINKPLKRNDLKEAIEKMIKIKGV